MNFKWSADYRLDSGDDFHVLLNGEVIRDYETAATSTTGILYCRDSRCIAVAPGHPDDRQVELIYYIKKGAHELGGVVVLELPRHGDFGEGRPQLRQVRVPRWVERVLRELLRAVGSPPRH